MNQETIYAVLAINSFLIIVLFNKCVKFDLMLSFAITILTTYVTREKETRTKFQGKFNLLERNFRIFFNYRYFRNKNIV